MHESSADNRPASSTTPLPSWAGHNPGWDKREIRGPRPDQIADVEAIAKALSDGQTGRGTKATAILACGLGKSALGVWTSQKMKAERVVIFFPTLHLIRQTMAVWQDLHDPAHPVDMAALCSLDASDLPVEECAGATTDPKKIRAWWKDAKPGQRKVLFVTYRSAAKAKQAFKRMANDTVPPIDLAIFDEAHHTTGELGKEAKLVLDHRELPAAARLFLTATPVTESIRRESAKAAGRAYSKRAALDDMADRSLYGDTVTRRGFRWGIDKGLLAPYDFATGPELGRELLVERQLEMEQEKKRAAGDAEAWPEGYARKAVITIAALKNGAAKRLLSYHESVANAKAFAAALRQAAPLLGAENFFAQALSSEDPIADRNAALARLVDPATQMGVVTSVNVLNEGIDVPAVDGVTFIDRRSSYVTIAQALGRAVRRDKQRPEKRATILIPAEPYDIQSGANEDYAPVFTMLRFLGETRAQIASFAEQLGVPMDQWTAETRPMWARPVGAERVRPLTAEELAPPEGDPAAPSNASTSLRAALSPHWTAKEVDDFFANYLAAEQFAVHHGHLLVEDDSTYDDRPIGAFLAHWQARAAELQKPKSNGELPEMTPADAVALQALRRLPDFVASSSREAAWRRGAQDLAEFLAYTGGQYPRAQSAAEQASNPEAQEEHRLYCWVKNRLAEKSARDVALGHTQVTSDGARGRRGENIHRTPMQDWQYDFIREQFPDFPFTLSDAERREMPDEGASLDRERAARRARRARAGSTRVAIPGTTPGTEKSTGRGDTPEEYAEWQATAAAVDVWLRANRRAPDGESMDGVEKGFARWLREQRLRVERIPGTRDFTADQRVLAEQLLKLADRISATPQTAKRSSARRGATARR